VPAALVVVVVGVLVGDVVIKRVAGALGVGVVIHTAAPVVVFLVSVVTSIGP